MVLQHFGRVCPLDELRDAVGADQNGASAPGILRAARSYGLRGRGVPHVRGRGRGDLLVRAVVDTPTDLSPEVEEILRSLAEQRGDEVAPPEKGFLSRIKSAFS